MWTSRTCLGCGAVCCLLLLWVVLFLHYWFAPVDIPVPPRQYPPNNAYAVYKVLAEQTYQMHKYDLKFRAAELRLFGTPSSTPDPQSAAYYLKQMEPIRKAYRQYLREPCVAIYEYDIGWLFPELSQFRGWGRTEMLDMRIAFKQGDTSRALDDYETILHFSEQIRNGGTLIHHGVGSYLQAYVQKPLAESFNQLSAADCERLVQITREWERYHVPLWTALEAEKYIVIALYRDIQRGRDLGIRNRWLALEFEWKAKFKNLRRGAYEWSQYIDQLTREMKKPLVQQKLPKVPVSPAEPVFSNLYIEDFIDHSFKAAVTEARARLIACAAAVRAYHLKHGRYPTSLQEAGVADLDRDPFTGGKFIYKVDPKKGFLLYSVGKNGRDDGGQRAPDEADYGDVSPVPYRPPTGAPKPAPLGPPAWLK